MQREDETGSIEIGKRADLQLLDTPDERELACEFAGAGPRMVVADNPSICPGRSTAADGGDPGASTQRTASCPASNRAAAVSPTSPPGSARRS